MCFKHIETYQAEANTFHLVAQTIYTRVITSSSEMEISELENVELEEIVTAEDQIASEDKETRAILASCGSHSNADTIQYCKSVLRS